MALLPGTRLGPYEIQSVLGAGGMGEVYQARDTRLDRTVAVKILPPHLAGNPQFRERFDREARVISQLDHPHICALYDVGEVSDPEARAASSTPLAFLVMPLLSGETLASRLQRGPLPLDQALRYATQIADALDKAHRRGVVHRDLKPANVMLTKDGAKLLDFGVAKASRATPAGTLGGAHVTALATTQEHKPELTVQGVVPGTLQYMSPEQLQGLEVDARSDVFAFGAMLHEMATGRRAFEAPTTVSVMAAILESDPPLVSSIQPMAPALLDHLVKTCLMKEPDARWQTMADVLIQLRLIATLESSPRRPVPRSTRPLIVAWSAAAACLVAGGVVGTLVVGRWSGSTQAAKLAFDVEAPGQGIGSPLQFALSPNGSYLVSVGGTDKGNVLWLRTLENQMTQTLAGTEGASNPFWSPDSRSIAFFADGKLKTVDLFGAPPQSVCDATRGAGGTWNRDGVIVFSTNPGPLLRVTATGGVPVPVTQLDASRAEVAHRFPSFLPDGRRFLYVAVSTRDEDSGVYVASLASAGQTRILAGGIKSVFSPPDRILFMRDDALMAQRFDPERLALSGDPIVVAEPVGANVQNSAAGYTVSDSGMLAYRSRDARNRLLAIFDRAGAQLGAFGSQGFHRNPATSADFTRVAVQDATTNDIWIIDRVRGSTSRFTVDRAVDNAPLWSPDGVRVVFASNRRGTFDLYQRSIDRAGQDEILLQSERAKIPEDWSADGRFVLFRSQGQETNSDLWILPTDGSRQPSPILDSPFEEREGRFSPDGRWVAYVSSEPGSLQVYVQSFPIRGPKWQVSTEGGHQPRWRSDGRELFFLSDARDAMAVAITTGSDGMLRAGAPQKLFATTAASFAERNSWDVSPDGQRFLINSVPIQRASLTVVVNWLKGLDAPVR